MAFLIGGCLVSRKKKQEERVWQRTALVGRRQRKTRAPPATNGRNKTEKGLDEDREREREREREKVMETRRASTTSG